MKKKIRLLIVDDYPMAAYGYEFLIKEKVQKNILEIQKAFNIDDALHLINTYKDNPFDIFLLDINMPSSKNEVILNGEDLSFKIKELFNESKIILLTTTNNPYRIKFILDNLEPNGFLIKTKITPTIFMEAIYTVLDNENYYSEKIKKMLKINSIDIDDFDIKILHFISLGEKMKNLPKYIPMSIATIERRKNKIKMQFNIPDCSDRELLTEATQRGYI